MSSQAPLTEARRPSGRGAEKKDDRVLVPDLGSLTSIHDRARELFYYLKGAQVDYGEDHNKTCGHNRALSYLLRAQPSAFCGALCWRVGCEGAASDACRQEEVVVEKTKTMIKSLYILSKVPLDSCKSACTCSSSWTGSCNARSMGCRLIVYHYCLSVLVPTNSNLREFCFYCDHGPRTISLDLNMEEMDISQAIDFIHRNASQGGTTLPMIYVLGDSLAPVENNNNLVTLLKANFLRNNIDYLGHKATGCFSNGKNSIDFLGRSSLNNHRETTSSCTRSAMLIGTKGKRFVKKRYAKKAQMKKT
uniref:Uncharacterized protein n=1 Tax=Zea mays TaxID=4577 RepID=A0A804PAW3_MAIZE